MKKIKVQPLSREAFYKYGAYAMLSAPENEPATGSKDAPFVFYRDMLLLDLGGAVPAFSTCQVKPRELQVIAGEFHNFTSEGAMPLDGDAVLWCAPAGAGKDFPADAVEAFYVPQGCMISLRPGVWHHALLPVKKETLNVMIVLPERAYNNDIYCIEIPESEQIAIEL